MAEEDKKPVTEAQKEAARLMSDRLSKLKKTPPADGEIGCRMPDGTIFAGISPDTNQPMYAAPADASICMNFNEAAKYAKNLDVGGKKDFRVPSRAELDVLFQNREKGFLKGTFNTSGDNTEGWYWTSAPEHEIYAWSQRFSDGYKMNDNMYGRSSVRCIRG